ncbi:hypothetical protein O5833_27015, partial [Escherichia coli]|nr:hypothetical protein [Escherichia coli]
MTASNLSSAITSPVRLPLPHHEVAGVLLGKEVRKRKTPQEKIAIIQQMVIFTRRNYANRSNAERAAKMQWERLQRGVASF